MQNKTRKGSDIKHKKMKFKIIILTTIVLMASCRNHENEFYYNYKCRIASTTNPENWRNGKFQGVNRQWLLQSLSDTTLYTIEGCYDDSLWFNRHNGDTLMWQYCRKNRWFHINAKK